MGWQELRALHQAGQLIGAHGWSHALLTHCSASGLHRELVDAWGRFRDDDEQFVAVLTGAGPNAFCAGADLKAAIAAVDPESDEEPLMEWSPEEIEAHNRGERDGILGPSRWTDIYKPIIAAVNGLAYAGGLEWACFADIRIADENASFGVTCRRWNIGLGDGGTQRLPRLVGMGRAMELIITGRVIDVSGSIARVELGEGIHAACKLTASAKAADDSKPAGGKVDLSSLGSMLQARWKSGGAASARPEEIAAGQVRSFRITKLEVTAKKIAVELA